MESDADRAFKILTSYRFHEKKKSNGILIFQLNEMLQGNLIPQWLPENTCVCIYVCVGLKEQTDNSTSRKSLTRICIIRKLSIQRRNTNCQERKTSFFMELLGLK